MESLGTFSGLHKYIDDLLGQILSFASMEDLHKIVPINTYFCRQATRSTALEVRLLGTFIKLDKETDILIGHILSWVSIVDLQKILLLNAHFSKYAKQCELWEKLLKLHLLPQIAYKCHVDEDKSHGEYCYPGCECYGCDNLRVCSKFKDLSAYEKCTKMMPDAKRSVKNLLSFYDLELQPKGFDWTWNMNHVQPEDAKRIEHTIKIQSHYPRRWILLHNIVSLTMAAEERGYEPDSNDTLGSFGSAFCGSAMDPNTGGSSFRDWYQGYMFPYSKSFDGILVGSDEHLRSLVGETHDEWTKLVTTLGNKALADSFDILYIVRGNLEELLLRYPGPSDQ
jgi:hypothetical protein